MRIQLDIGNVDLVQSEACPGDPDWIGGPVRKSRLMQNSRVREHGP